MIIRWERKVACKTGVGQREDSELGVPGEVWGKVKCTPWIFKLTFICALVNSLFSASALGLPTIIFSEIDFTHFSFYRSVSGFFLRIFEEIPFCVWIKVESKVGIYWGSWHLRYCVRRITYMKQCPSYFCNLEYCTLYLESLTSSCLAYDSACSCLCGILGGSLQEG